MTATKTATKISFGTVIEHFETALNVINQLLIGFVTLWISWACIRSDFRGILLHTWLVTFGFCFLMAEGMMSFYNGNWTTKFSRQTKTVIHITLEILGGGLGVAGCLVQLIHDDFKLVTLHGKLGFAAFILCLVSLLSGVCAFLARIMSKCWAPVLNKSVHIFLSLTTFVIAMMAQYYGYTQAGIFRKPGKDFMQFMQVTTMIMMVLTCIAPLKSLYNNLRNAMS